MSPSLGHGPGPTTGVEQTKVFGSRTSPGVGQGVLAVTVGARVRVVFEVLDEGSIVFPSSSN